MLTKSMFIVLLTVLACSLLEKDAHAYLDPGTGTYVFQVAVAFLLTTIFTVKSFWSKIKMFVAAHFQNKNTKK